MHYHSNSFYRHPSRENVATPPRSGEGTRVSVRLVCVELADPRFTYFFFFPFFRRSDFRYLGGCGTNFGSSRLLAHTCPRVINGFPIPRDLSVKFLDFRRQSAPMRQHVDSPVTKSKKRIISLGRLANTTRLRYMYDIIISRWSIEYGNRTWRRCRRTN